MLPPGMSPPPPVGPVQTPPTDSPQLPTDTSQSALNYGMLTLLWLL